MPTGLFKTLFSFIALLHTRNTFPLQEKSVAKLNMFAKNLSVPKTKLLAEKALAALAKGFRKKAGKSRAQAARAKRGSQTSIFNADESPAQSLHKGGARMIETYSPFRVIGPVFHVRKKSYW